MTFSPRFSAVLLLSLFFVEALLPMAPATALTASAPVTISVRAVPSILPADGQSYPAIYVSLVDTTGLPALALSNVTVFLSTSSPAVGTVLNSSLVIRAGKSYAMALFETTPTAGQTVITASATGYTAGTSTLTTSVPRGYPSSIILTPVPSEVNSTTTSARSGTVIVELQDPAGQPAKAVTGTQVSVYSSSPQILILNQTSFTLAAGQLLKVLSFTTGFIPGSAVITASAPQLASGVTQVTVLGRPPLALRVTAQPSKMVVSGSGRLVVALTDLQGKPTRAPAPILVELRSSGPGFVQTAADHITIPTGSMYAAVVMTSGTNPTCTPSTCDTVTITASSSGLKSGFVTITTYIPGAISDPLTLTLNLNLGPNPVLADHGNYSVAEVSLVNGSGIPTVAPSDLTLILTSSHNSTGGNFGPTYYTEMVLRAGFNDVIWGTQFTSSYAAGITFLTVSTQGALPSIGNLTTFGPVPSKIAIASLFQAVPADGGSHPALQVSLEDASGSPAAAPAPVIVYLTSSQTGIVQVKSPITIKTGDSAAVVNIVTTSVSGFANMTAYTYSLSSGYASAATAIRTVTPSPSVIGAALSLGTFSPSPFQNSTNLILQLQDSGGNPAKARVPTVLTVTSSNAAVYNRTIQAQIPQGSSYTVITLVPLSSGSTTITVSSPGLLTASAQLEVLSSPLSLQITSPSLSIIAGQVSVVTLTVSVDGVGLANAKVSWSASSGVISPPSAVTDPTGQASATFKPGSEGVVTISATISFSYGSPQRASTVLLVGAPSSSNNQGLLGTLLSFPYVLIIVGAAAAAVVAVLLVIRRRKRAAEAEGAIGEEASFSYFDLSSGLGSW